MDSGVPGQPSVERWMLVEELMRREEVVTRYEDD